MSKCTAEWWLRSPGGSTDSAATVDRGGNVIISGYTVDRDSIGVRPALRVKY